MGLKVRTDRVFLFFLLNLSSDSTMHVLTSSLFVGPAGGAIVVLAGTLIFRCLARLVALAGTIALACII
jgi:hypothetical protein